MPEIAGKRFGRWLVLDRSGSDKYRRALWRCKCKCGVERIVIGSDLTAGRSKSCGCLSTGNTRHGMTRSPTHQSWRNMRRRCLNPGSKDYGRYGGRGISVCERWDLFENFLADMGERPRGTSIDRINNNEGYSPRNCQWSTPGQQMRNTSKNVKVDFKGVVVCLADAAKMAGLKTTTVYNRRHSGWPESKWFVKPGEIE